jgi:hypothetical protein
MKGATMKTTTLRTTTMKATIEPSTLLGCIEAAHLWPQIIIRQSGRVPPGAIQLATRLVVAARRPLQLRRRWVQGLVAGFAGGGADLRDGGAAASSAIPFGMLATVSMSGFVRLPHRTSERSELDRLLH